MMRHLKALGLALMAILALGAVAAQGASAAVEHEFHSDGPKTIATGSNSIIGTNGKGETETQLSTHTFAVGSAGTWTCNKVETESTQTGTEVSAGTYKSDTVTVTPRYEECTFGGQPATVHFNHCAYVFDSDTTEAAGTSTAGEHASVDIECAKNEAGEDTKIEITTSVCTITIGPQTIPHAVSYENDKHNLNAINIIWTAHKVVLGKKGAGSGCLLFPTGAIGKYTGTVTSTCTRDDNLSPLEGTAKTTPKGTTIEGPQTRCTVSPGA